MALTVLVGWPIIGDAPWEKDSSGLQMLMCEDALERRRTTEQALARLGRERQETMIDAKRLSEIFDDADADIQRYCLQAP